jgi:hypothetical protein
MFRTGRLEALISGEWYGEKKGRLKPCVEALEQDAPHGFDYTWPCS